MNLSDDEYINISLKHKQIKNKLNSNGLCMKNKRKENSEDVKIKCSLDYILDGLNTSDIEVDTSVSRIEHKNVDESENKNNEQLDVINKNFNSPYKYKQENDSYEVVRDSFCKSKQEDDSYELTRRLKIVDEAEDSISYMEDNSDDVIIIKKNENVNIDSDKEINLESENLFSILSDDIAMLSDVNSRNSDYINNENDLYDISSISDDISISKIYSTNGISADFNCNKNLNDKIEENNAKNTFELNNPVDFDCNENLNDKIEENNVKNTFELNNPVDFDCNENLNDKIEENNVKNTFELNNPTDFDHHNYSNPFLYECLHKYFNLNSFRVNQEDVIIDCINGRDVFVLMPTGGGKSLCFQLSALLLDGVSIVISPLLSLIEDQVRNLLEKNILALRLVGGMTREEVNVVYEAVNRGMVKLLYVTPELFCRSERLCNLKNISRIVVDEAHCVSQWGFDFRPDYVQLAETLRTLNVPVIALTATANNRVERDIISFLKNPKIYRSSFNRKNIKYEVREKNKNTLLNMVSFINAYYPNSRGIIYCTTKKDCEEVTDKLYDYKINAKYYHAGLSPKDRRNIQENWSKDLRIIVATIAFGMGIDRKDVRFVMHYSLPKSIEGYYQESGRAGRDGLESISILYYNYADKRKIDFLIEQSYKNNRNFKDRNQKLDVKQRSKDELSAVIEYCENKVTCRRTLILQYFGEKFSPTNCTGCDNCKNKKKYIKINVDKKITTFLISKIRQKDFTINQLIIECKKYLKNTETKTKGKNTTDNKKNTEDNIFHSLSTFLYKTKIIVIERTIKKLLEQNIIKEKIITNRIGYSNVYLAYNFKECKNIEIVIEDTNK